MIRISKIALITSLTSLSFLLSQSLCATPIELNNKNPALCTQQLESAKDIFPIILVYATHCPAAQMFLPTYQKVASDDRYKNRDFFQFDYDSATEEAVQKCLGIASFDVALVSPIVTVVIQLPDATGNNIIRSMPIRSWEGVKMDPEDPSQTTSITPEELEHIIKVSPNELRLKSELAKRSLIKQRG